LANSNKPPILKPASMKRNIPMAGHELSDADFKPNFEQKGVDM
jgi:hypothetical protein